MSSPIAEKNSLNIDTMDLAEVTHNEADAIGVRDDLIIADGEKEINRFVWYLSSVAGISGFLYGWDTAVVGGALANIGDALGHELNSVEQEWAVASLSAGAVVGTLVGGTFSDK